jgi:hypothetical protein
MDGLNNYSRNRGPTDAMTKEEYADEITLYLQQVRKPVQGCVKVVGSGTCEFECLQAIAAHLREEDNGDQRHQWRSFFFILVPIF